MNLYKDTLFDLTGKNAAIFGGAGQIGTFSSEIILKAGGSVIIYDIQSEEDFLSKSSDLILKAFESKHLYYRQIDITDERQVRDASASLKQTLNTLDIIINHAHFKGDPKTLKPHSPFFASVEDYPFEVWNETMATNLNGLFLVTKLFGSLMVSQKSGVIINTSSTYGCVSPREEIYSDSGINSPISYATSKSAILNFSRYLATHWAKHNIRVNTISPGGVENINQSEEFKTNYSRNTPLGRLAKPDEYQGTILYLASSASSYVTGANILADGGWTAW